MSVFDCVVIGAGPAGMTASIYLKRANKNIVLLEKSAPGGQILKTNIVENYLGFTSIDGPTLATNMYNQINSLKINYQYGNVMRIEKSNENYKIITDNGEFYTKKVIIATGRTPRQLGLENEEKLVGKGISYCATCDGFLYKNKIVAVVGGGNTAFEEAIYLSKICKEVYVFNRSELYRAEDKLQEELKKISNVKVFNNSKVTKIIEEKNKLDKIEINNETIYEVSGLFVFIGQVPTKFMIEGIETKDNYIIVDRNMKTNLEGIYACGDIIKKDFYQISTAVGDATVAALNIIKELKG